MAPSDTLIILHRVATIAHADRILVLDGCTIGESGRHEELLALREIDVTRLPQPHSRSRTSVVRPRLASFGVSSRAAF